jgi:hypothetical protein
MCILKYKVRRNEDIADVTEQNRRNWLLGEVKIHLVGIREDKKVVEFKLWRFYTTGKKEGAQCLYDQGVKEGYFRNTASKNDTIKKEYHPQNLTKRNEIIKEWMRRKEIDHVVVEVFKVACQHLPCRDETA